MRLICVSPSFDLVGESIVANYLSSRISDEEILLQHPSACAVPRRSRATCCALQELRVIAQYFAYYVVLLKQKHILLLLLQRNRTNRWKGEQEGPRSRVPIQIERKHKYFALNRAKGN